MEAEVADDIVVNFENVLTFFLKINPKKTTHEIIFMWLRVIGIARQVTPEKQWKEGLKEYLSQPGRKLKNIDEMYRYYSVNPAVKDIWIAKQEILAEKEGNKKSETRDHEDIFHMEL